MPASAENEDEYGTERRPAALDKPGVADVCHPAGAEMPENLRQSANSRQITGCVAAGYFTTTGEYGKVIRSDFY